MNVNECFFGSFVLNVFIELLECEKFFCGDSDNYDNCDILVIIFNRFISVLLNF